MSNKEDLLKKENKLLKNLLQVEQELAEQEEEEKGIDDGLAGLRKLTLPPKVDASFYTGNLDNLKFF